MRIALFAALLGEEATGQSVALANMASRLADAGHSVTVLATDCGYQGKPVTKFVAMPANVALHIFPSRGRLNRRLYRSPALLAWMREHIADFDLLDVQGIWSVTGMALARLFRAQGKPYVLTPHGTMTRYDWRKGPLQRRLFFALGFRSAWRGAGAIRFLSQGEIAASFHPAARRGVAIPNGIDLCTAPTAESRTAARTRLGVPNDASMLLFLGRMTHQKGVKETLAAFELAAPNMLDLRLYLVGPPEGEYGAEVLAAIERSPVRERIVTTGAIFGDAKVDYFRAADAFITLSHNEGMSIAHLEALSHGLPMILTASSNMDLLEEYGAGVITDHDARHGAQAILQMMGSPECRAEAARHARRLVQERFSWEQVTPQLTRLYAEIVEERTA